MNQISELLQQDRIVISDLASEDKTKWTNLESFIGKTPEPPSLDELLALSKIKSGSSISERLVKKDTASSDNEIGETNSFFTEENELRTITKPKKNTITSGAKGVVKTQLKDESLTQPPKKKTLLLLSLGLVGVIVVSFSTWILSQDSISESFEKLMDTRNVNNSKSNGVTYNVDKSLNQESALPKEILDTNFKTLPDIADQENQNTNQIITQEGLVDSELKEISDSSNYFIRQTVKDSINPIIRPLL